MNLPPIAGLYAITPELDDTARLLAGCDAALRGGARVLQYRNKSAGRALRLEHALGLSAICRRTGATFIVNDDLELALEVEADGVHLGRGDGDLAAARRRIGRGRRLGASCYDRIDLADRAAAAGADAIAVISGLFDAPDVEARARAFAALFRASPSSPYLR